EVERLADFVQGGNQFRVTDAVTDSQTGQAVDFGKGSHQNQIRLFAVADQRQQIQRVFKKINVGLVHDEQRILRHFLDKTQDVFKGSKRSRGVVRVRHENDP